MKVSVVVPVYNEEAIIGKCLKAIFSQSEPADEVILVDNNCTDNSMKIAKKYPVRIIKEKQQGISYARNKGFDRAKYEIIARTDSDVTVNPNWIERIKFNFKAQKIDALAGTVSFPNLIGSWGANLLFDLIKLAQGNRQSLFGLNMAISKTMWQKVRTHVIMDNKQVHEDLDLALWVWACGGKIILDKNLVAQSSSRRIVGNPYSFFVEYPRRTLATIAIPRKLSF
ncbi:hypothetical protein A2313_04080 [Candidatus Roizmanbacteria bacterium RIFOXYB2_FULL_41_10]|uniref:Glycosyltransferase 2-like domain-containing protein n=1 Tax=Candidatus Roizmanbacteria bacterium RIFOXYA1_FULL_41_12 TaxID=1802082 RepID=A0A1F7K9M7_9BACT|nr:MAG: hypothetical protein A2209_03330 [Candidatus Roizmanbacteria bacterium RIFOXYA1_FULL_41_12]OGK66388.1 MAG: hypothetical protein A2377_03510 [Candidatus Roizmanbacteria bacterium RIFOXYB1_FULL_41_27]OGK71789.1 MAG: hypothetical protein A2313_04080 [Candidatus Roizmanbacteria bacterium RIFOXYB2_FULL_41_10]OGK72482.1 MAG: hypothetical protein A2403_04040 [Candidatus Roizmanbacteria bacterium RIFOXYC1_FULL_41_16]OGK75412.1 MAG: hypothetical protein A2459_01690 [Candidatus Roizmanbacteria ba